MLFVLILRAEEKQVVAPYTLADRDRAILAGAKINSLETKINTIETKITVLETKITALEIKVNTLDDKMEVRFENLQKQIDDIKALFYWGFGILITLFLFLLGYNIWDRRTAMKPALILASKAEENSRSLTATLRAYSKNHPDLAEILRTHGLL